MKRRRIFLFLLGFVAAVAVGIFIWPREREPEYNGVCLSEWLERYAWAGSTFSVNSSDFFAARTAITHIGTNAVPFLVRWIQYERPAWRQSLYDASRKTHRNIHNSRTFWQLLTLGDKSRRADNAVGAFRILRSKAEPAIPELKRLAQKSPMTETSGRAIACLYLIGRDSYDNTDLSGSR